jgi:hypothetical protein
MAGEDRVRWLDLVPVSEAANEDTAIHLCALLQSAGIEARVRSAQVAAFDGAFSAAVGYWGQVLVPRADALRAREFVTEFLQSDCASPDSNPEGTGEAAAADEEPPSQRSSPGD